MTPALCMNQAPVPPPSYHRTMATALHLDALTLVTRLHLLHLLEVCRVAVRLAQRDAVRPPSAGRGADRLDPYHAGSGRRHSLESQAAEEAGRAVADLDGGGTGQADQH